MLRQTISQSVCPGVKFTLEPVTRYYTPELYSIKSRLVWILFRIWEACCLWRVLTCVPVTNTFWWGWFLAVSVCARWVSCEGLARDAWHLLLGGKLHVVNMAGVGGEGHCLLTSYPWKWASMETFPNDRLICHDMKQGCQLLHYKCSADTSHFMNLMHYKFKTWRQNSKFVHITVTTRSTSAVM
jgi:hypothetical protein